MTSTTLQSLQDKIAEIEKRIKNLSLNLTTSKELGAIKVILEAVKELLLNYQTEFEQHLTDCDENTQEINNQLSINMQALLTMQELLNETDTKIEEIEDQLELLVAGGGSSSGGSGDGENVSVDIGQFIDFSRFGANSKQTWKASSQKIWFFAEPGQYVKIEIRGRWFSHIFSSNVKYLRLFLNNQCIGSKELKENEPGYYTITGTGGVSEKLNSFYLDFDTYDMNHEISHIFVNIIGKKVAFITPKNSYNQYCFGGKIYICYKDESDLRCTIVEGNDRIHVSTFFEEYDTYRETTTEIFEAFALPYIVEGEVSYQLAEPEENI